MAAGTALLPSRFGRPGALVSSDDRYRSLVENMHDGYAYCRGVFVQGRLEDFVYLDVNPAFEQLTGLKNVIGEPVSRVIPALRVSHPELFELYGRVAVSGTPEKCEAYLAPLDMSLAISVYRPEPGHFVAVFDNITLRKASEAQLAESQQRLILATESAGIGIWDMDYASGTLRWSAIMEAHYGLLPGTFGGTLEAFMDCIHPDDRESVRATLARAMASGEDFSMLHRAMHPGGTVRWLSGAGRILLDEAGQAVRGAGISQDVTDRHNLEAQYLHAQKMEAVGQLAGGVAHDFNNLLTVILGFCELLLGDPDNERCRDDVVEIQKAGLRAAGLTRQLLDFSRKQIIEPKPHNLTVVVAEMQAMLRRLIGENIQIVLGLQPGLWAIRADRGQIEQIVMNLAVNARDAMPNGGTLTIDTANVEIDAHAAAPVGAQPGPYVALTITDTGAGMSREVLGRLFQPFFTTKEVGKGTGLGLATIHGIVTRGAGCVTVASEPGKGARFTVYLPMDEAAEIVDVAPAPRGRSRSGGETVLLVEDADGLRALVHRMLTGMGYTVLVAANAKDALALFERHPSIDVILTDVVMPGGSGPELTKRLITQRPGLKVMYMSGYTDEAIVHHGVLEPGIVFIHKPFTADTLARKVREVLDR